MIRFLYLNTFVAICTIIFCLWALLLSLFGASGSKTHFLVAVPWAKVILKVCGITVRPKGQERVDPLVPRIYMTNHQSYFDIFALLAYVPVGFKFILKQELMRLPFLGPAMRRAGYIGIERKDPREAIKSMNEAAEKIRAGSSVVMFPEGTRSVDGRLLPFKKGGFKLALKSGCDIVPVSISNSYRIVPKGSLKINKGVFHICIGDPIPVKGYNRKSLTQLMERVRADMLNQMEER
ncbi:MAG: 1-acyl-sn-glycerol-3-phosphate acyltransferase [Deltaproteobacteria bacterium]|nr:1-acyl-sn-glycerol-3-phosphate acyltransferase [Deltaproteobacteria bacterium]MBW2343527.1 1-acyl-sn-glycerol-3-phosphate acyltransferase [Deltaproteobacteria bacterium]